MISDSKFQISMCNLSTPVCLQILMAYFLNALFQRATKVFFLLNSWMKNWKKGTPQYKLV
jgi:hypothetical protein